jgi:hypothetical protein
MDQSPYAAELWVLYELIQYARMLDDFI